MPAVPARFFGMHIRRATASETPQTPWLSSLGFRSVRHWDNGLNWRQIESSEGAPSWSKMDASVALAVANDCEVVHTLGQPPDWATGDTSSSEYGSAYNSIPPTSDAEWTAYVSAIVRRLPRGSVIQPWNEPNLAGFYSGSVARLIELHILAYDTAKAIDPTCRVMSAAPSGNGTSYLYSYLAGVAAHTDIVGMHGYVFPKPPEALVQRIRWIRAIATKAGLGGKPIWNGEWTWHSFYEDGELVDSEDTSVIMSDDLAVAYLARALLCCAACGIERAFFYGLDQAWSKIRLIDDLGANSTVPQNIVLTPAAEAFRWLAAVLPGATVSRSRQRPPLYTVDYRRDGVRGRFYWCDDGETEQTDLSGFSRGFDARGRSIALSGAYEVGHSPVLAIY